MDLAGLAFSVSVEKDGTLHLAERFGKFGGELVAGDNFDVEPRNGFGKQVAGLPPKRIITAQRISVTDDECVVHNSQLKAVS